jgi:predicted transcriptional regulator of viral defense system
MKRAHTKKNILACITQLRRPVFTSHEIVLLSGKSASAVTQALNHLAKQGVIVKAYRGIWAEAGNSKVSQYALIPFLPGAHRQYVSFVSALHLHGIIEQIPQVITLASTSHTRTVRTKLGAFVIHQIAPEFFKGFNWYRDEGSFLIAEPEKALVDCLYLSGHKKRQFGHFPELHLPVGFSLKKAKAWAEVIPYAKARANVLGKLELLLRNT